MLKKLAICFALAGAVAVAQDAKSVIAGAQKALGDVKSITYSGTGKDVSFQQCGANATDMVCRGTHDPMRPINNYVRVIDLAAPASRATGATNNQGGGGSTTVSPGTFSQQISAAQIAATTAWSPALEFYLTPWGFLKGAADNNATIKEKKSGHTVLTWSPAVKAPSGKNYVINGYVDGKGIVDHVETWWEDNVMGDMHIDATYTGWKDFGGVMAPAKIVQTRGGWPFFSVDVTAAKANPADLATLALPPAPAAGKGGPGGPPGGGAAKGAPAPGGAAKGGPAPGGGAAKGGPAPLAPAMNVTSEKLGDGLYRLSTGAGSYDSIIVEFKDYVMMLEAGQSIARGEAYIAETKKLIPNKPIRYVANTHPHSDHTGGLPALVAEGATIVTHKNNVEFFDRALNTPRTLMTDVLAKNPKKAKVEGVGDKKVFSDGTRVVEIYYVPNAPHSNGLTFFYIPKEKILFQGDFTVTPGQPANDHVKALYPTLEKLKLDYNRYIPVHYSTDMLTKADVDKAWALSKQTK
jgi:glyoxylase-like metal-dependent hydrolase (beta-lactamase superfamily II)